MRHVIIFGLILVFACAEGVSDVTEDDGGLVSAGQGGATSAAGMPTGSGAAPNTSNAGGMSVSTAGGPGPGGTGGAPGCMGNLVMCNSVCVDIQTDSLNCGGCNNLCAMTQSCVGGVCTTMSTTTTTNVASSVASSSSTGGGTCSPLNPSLQCGPNNHCVPQTNGIPLCQSPTGSGIQYSACNTPADCAPIYECVQTPYLTVYCMQWCSVDFDCPGWPFDLCNFLNPSVYVGSVEWGVCYDGLP